MYARCPRYVPVLLFLVCTATAACDRLDITATSPAPADGVKASLTAEPASVRPEFLPSLSCPTRPAFGIRILIIVSGGDVILRAIRFGFTDRLGDLAFPQVLPTPSLSSPSTSFPSSSPIPIPGAAPLPGSSVIPIPGALPIEGLLVSGSRSLPFVLTFGCGLVPEGTITITADTANRNGNSGTSQLMVPVRR
ncbi:MAG TPA: hypothetical protein VJ813_00595 [Vicinamibacterales bacterium]|nr:hypothetical protein [Vicinamibacterales bacterium]